MNIHILTLQPELYSIITSHSILSRSKNKNIWNIFTYNMRNFSQDKRKKVDSKCISGGPGMLIQPHIVHSGIIHILESIGYEKETNIIQKYENSLKTEESQENILKIHKKIFKIIEKIQRNVTFIHFSPRGKLLNQKLLTRLYKDNQNKTLIVLCGRYEGIDARVTEYWKFYEVSIGDYILTNGDIASITFLDSYIRLHSGVLGNSESIVHESFENYLLEANNYTKPVKWNGISCPNVLLSGNHFLIDSWKLIESQRITSLKRPDLWSKYIENKENSND